MKKLIRLGSIGLVIAGAITIASDVSAQLTVPPLSATPEATGGTFRVTIFGTPRTQVPVTLSGIGTSVSRTFRANGCGFVIIPNAVSFANLRVNNTLINVTDVLAATPIVPPTCQGTQSSALPLPSHDYDPGDGITFSQSWNIGGGSILFRVPTLSDAPNGRFVDATYSDNSARSRFVSLNGCGLGTVSRVSGIAQITVDNGTPSAVNSLVSTAAGLRCSGDKVLAAITDFSFPDPLPSVYKDSNNNVYFTAAAGATVPVGLEAQASTRSVTSDRCGGLSIGSALRPQTTSFTIGGETIDPATLSIGLRPSCRLTNGSYAYDVVPSGNFKTSDGVVFLKNTTANPTGFGDRRILSITTSGSATRNLTANACGIAQIRSSATAPITGSTSFTHDGTSYTVSALPVQTATCVNAGTASAPNLTLFRAMN